MDLETEERHILSVLRAYKSVRRIPWGITALGWETYAKHPSEKVRQETLAHPNCPEHLRVSIPAEELSPA
ncbi:MAG: hypothetical protein JWL87_409 [Candidatus Adlerbacteria bacterium]|nr:hypothetical protein [Candidatus Adlerbacteria bacterium]